MNKTYFVIAEQAKGQTWTIAFGDYERAVCVQEMRDMKESGSWVRGTKLQLIKTTGRQADIDAAIAAMNQ